MSASIKSLGTANKKLTRIHGELLARNDDL